MSFDSEYLALRKKRKEKENKNAANQSTNKPVTQQLISNHDEIAPFLPLTPTTTVSVPKVYAPTVSVAPVKTDDKRTWFQKGEYFSDGSWDKGDLTKTILGTLGDVGENIATALLGLPEKAVDGLVQLFGTTAHEEYMKQVQADQLNFNLHTGNTDKNENVIAQVNENKEVVKKSVADFVEKDLYNEQGISKAIISAPIKEATGIDTEAASVLGEKSDALVQSGSQLLATLGLQAAGVPWWLTTGVTSFGGQAEAAYNEGASFDEATGSAFIATGAEILSEKLFGAINFGGKTLDDVLLKPFTEQISSKVLKKLVDLGVDAGGEGLEEVFSEIISNLGTTLYKDESVLELLTSEEAVDEYIESFIGGSFLGGTSSTVRAVTGRNKVELTENEQKVFDKVVEDRIAEATKDGQKLTKSEEAKLRKAVLYDMQKGNIATDTIESVLGGETYKAYKDSVDSEKALQDEFDALNKMKTGEMTGEQTDRRTELKQQLQELKNNSNTSSLKEQLSSEVMSLVKGSRLSESYNEKTRRRQAFTADLSKYDAKQQETVKRAVESGILNDTNRTHDFVDMIAKISADKGVSFDFINNHKLKESGFALEGKTVNGYVTGDGNVAINIDSVKSLNTVVGHEITHILEGTELYNELQQTIVEYAKTKGEYQSRYDAIAKLYEGVEGANIDNELAADLVGDYLFTDSDFVSRLSTENRNVFQKIYDEIKYLCRIATAGSKEAKQLEKVKRTLEKAYRETKAEKNTAEGGVRYDIVALDNGNVYVKASRKVIKETTVDGMRRDISQFFNELLEGELSLDVPTIDGEVLTITKTETADKARDNYKTINGQRIKMSDDEFAVKMHIESHIDEVAEVSTPDGKKNDSKNHSFANRGFTYRKAYFQDFDGQYYEVTLSIGHNGTIATVYNVGKIKGSVLPSAKILAVVGSKPLGKTPSKHSIYNSTENVKQNGNLSLSSDNTAPQKYGNYNVYGDDVMLQSDDIAPVRKDAKPVEKPKTVTEDIAPVREDLQAAKPKAMTDDIAPVREDLQAAKPKAMTDDIAPVREDIKQDLLSRSAESFGITKPGDYVQVQRQVFDTLNSEGFFDDKEGKSKTVINSDSSMQVEINKKGIKETFNFENYGKLGRKHKEMKLATIRMLPQAIQNGKLINDDVDNYHNKKSSVKFAYIESVVKVEGRDISVKIDIKKSPEKNKFWVHSVDVKERVDGLPANVSKSLKRVNEHTDSTNSISNSAENVNSDDIAPVREDITPKRKAIREKMDYITESEETNAKVEADEATKNVAERPTKRSELHHSIVENIKTKFTEKGFDFDKVLENAKNMATIRINDNTPQRVMKKTFGPEEGDILADETVNKVAQNETEGIKWLNSYLDRKNGVLVQISKQYGIKPGSKESAAAQKYAEGFYVDKKSPKKPIYKYDDAKLAQEFPDIKTQSRIKGLARDPRIRQIYDETLDAINEARKRNLYPEIPKRDNYFLHFRAMEDTFSLLGLPFNPNDIRAKDLPTDINGITADLKPGQPYFPSAQERKGIRTSFDLLGGLERYLTSAKNQIYHIDDIQTLRALRNYIADSFGRAEGLESLDNMTDEEAEHRITQVYKSHLSNFAKFLNEEANVIAGKTVLIDRGIEGLLGRRAITFLDDLNKQVGSNLVGYNISSPLTNVIPVVQTFAKTNKFDFLKAFAQTASNKVNTLLKKDGDGFTEKSSVIIRRKGAEQFYRKPYQKIADVGYVLMSAVDNISTELIARTKFNEFTRKGMNEQQAHFETDKWVSGLMGDRSLGQLPMLYNSKLLNMVVKFQLEVRIQLDSQFYDTIQEAKLSNKDIENGLLRNAKTAAKVTSTFFQLAVAQHLFGKAFEAVAGYNPAFDIIEAIIKACGFDDDEEDEDTVLDNIEEALFALAEDMPYANLFVGGGRIPVSSALPIGELWRGEDQYGNEKPRGEILKEAVPYYILPGGYGQIKKTVNGLKMFDDDFPVAGSYTDSGNLRFPVEDTPANRIHAAIFGQYASKNAREYFDEGYAPLKEKQIEEYKELDLPIADYWKYREGLSGLKTLNEKGDYIGGLDLSVEKKNLLINNIAGRETPIDMTDYHKYSDFQEFDFATRYPEKYKVLQDQGISVKEYKEKHEETAFMHTDDFSWAANNPEQYAVSKAVSDDVTEYKKYTADLYNIKADKDKNGKSISGSRKKKVIEYINGLDIDDGAKYILFKSEYKADDTYNREIINYLNGRDDISSEAMRTILTELDFKIDSDGKISW